MNNPFESLTRLQINKLYDLLAVHVYKYSKNEEIFPTIKSGNIIGIVMSGNAQIIYTEYNGNEIVMENLFEYGVFGTNISGTNDENYQIVAKEDSEVLVIDYNKLLNPKNLKYSYFNVFFMNLFDIINEKFKERNERVKILEKKQIREKLLEYFEIQHKKTRSRFIYLPFNFKDLADYIAVNRSAMFRELKNLKEEKFIEVKDKRITLLYK